jgi:hypothetical protein
MSYYINAKNIDNNSIIRSQTPLNIFIKSKHIYGLFNENDFKILINKKIKYNFFISKNNSILFEFVIDVNSIIDKLYTSYDRIGYSTQIPYTHFFYINYPNKSLIYSIFSYILPNEIIEIIIKHLKLKINYRFTLHYLNHIYLTQPKINIPSIFH